MAVDLDQLNLAALAQPRRGATGGQLEGCPGLIIALIWVVPFWFLFLTIFKSTEEYAAGHPLAWPDGVAPCGQCPPRLGFGGAGHGHAEFRGYMALSVPGSGFLAAMAAFALSRLDMPRREAWFLLIFAGTSFPFRCI